MKKTFAVMACAFLLLVAFSGCVGSIGTAPGMKNLDKARDLAKTRIESPELMHLESIEPFNNYTEDEYQILIHADDNPGDGKAPGGMYAFYGNGKAMAAILLANGEVLAEIWNENASQANDAFEDVKPIKNVEYDSDDVAKILLEDGRWPKMNDSTNVIWGLEMEDGNPIWEAEATNMHDGNTTTAYVYANNGTILEIETYNPYDYYMGYYENAEYEEYNYTSEGDENYAEDFASGTVTPVSSISAEIFIEDFGTVSVVAQATIVAGVVTVTLENDLGVVWSSDLGALSTLVQTKHTEENLLPGRYWATITGSAGVCDGSIYIYGQW
jgi:hypothetical protein